MYASALAPFDQNAMFRETWVGENLASNPARVIDVGARDGIHPIFGQFGRLCAMLGFEPDPEGYAALCADQDLARSFHQVHIEPLAVGAGGLQRFHTYAAPTNNSLLAQNDAVTRRYNMVSLDPRETFEIETRRLDDVIFDSAKDLSGFGEIIKLDTQGSEQQILEHAPRMLAQNTVAVVSEVWFCQVYKDQPLFHHLCVLMEEQGFQFYGFLDIFLRSGKRLDKRFHVGRERALYADAVFLRDPLAEGMPAALDDRMLRRIALLIPFAMATGYFDFALELADQFGGDDRATLSDAINRHARADIVQATQDLCRASDAVRQNTDNAMIEMGRFADRWRSGFDYADVA